LDGIYTISIAHPRGKCNGFFIERGKLFLKILRQHRTIRQGVTAEDFVPDQGFQTGGILYVFPGLETAELVQKIRCDPQTQLCGVA